MTAQSPGAYALSVSLHAAAIALLLAITWWLKQSVEENPVILTIAGDGNNYLATKAAALGEEGGKGPQQALFTPQPAPTPQPLPPAPEPPAETLLQPAPAPVTAVVDTPKTPDTPKPTKAPAPTSDMAKAVHRLATKRAENVRQKYLKEQKEIARKEALAEAKRMSKAEFDKANQTKSKAGPATTAKAVKLPSVAEGMKGGAVGGNAAVKFAGAGGEALRRAEADAMQSYIAMICSRIKQTMERAGFSDALNLEVQFAISAAGLVSNPQITKSSGSGDFDRAVLEAFRSIGNIGPPPNRKSDVYIVPLEMSAIN